MENQGIISKRSKFSVKDTMDRFEAILNKKGVTIYARINQQTEAAKVGIALNGLEFLLFGNPKKGGMVMVENPEAALDLPLKVLVWEDAQHVTWVTYNETGLTGQRFSLKEETAKLTDIDPLITELLNS